MTVLRPSPGGCRGGRFALVGVLVLGAGLTTACDHPQVPSLSGSVSACFRAIPPATAAVHEPKARLLGVHRVPADKVTSHLPPPDRSMVDQDTVVCAVAFKGTFAPGQVDKARPTDQGQYAVVLVTSKKLQLLASYVLPTLPKRFQGRFT